MISTNPVKSLGQTVYQIVFGALLLIVVGQFLWGKFHSWRSGTWKERATDAQEAATQAQANADSADAGASNATTTRQNIDAGTVTVRVETEQSAQRMESYANRAAPVADLDPIDPDIVRELEQAESRARSAAAGLQRTHAR